MESQLMDPLSVFDRPMVDPSFDRELAVPMSMANEMLRRAGWADMVTKPFKTMARQQRKALGPLSNIIKADISESSNNYSLEAGIKASYYMLTIMITQHFPHL
jgi:hypothetical protein